MTGLLLSVGLGELGEQGVDLQLEVGADGVAALVAVHRHVVCTHRGTLQSHKKSGLEIPR